MERFEDLAQCAIPDGPWLARNLDKFMAIKGRLVLKPEHRDAVLKELGAMGDAG